MLQTITHGYCNTFTIVYYIVIISQFSEFLRFSHDTIQNDMIQFGTWCLWMVHCYRVTQWQVLPVLGFDQAIIRSRGECALLSAAITLHSACINIYVVTSIHRFVCCLIDSLTQIDALFTP